MISAPMLTLTLALLQPHHDARPNIVETAVRAGSFETLVTAVKTAHLVEALESDGPFTVFAPDDSAFGSLPEGTVASLLKKDKRSLLTDILTYHVVPGRFDAEQVRDRRRLTTLNDQTVRIEEDRGGLRVGGARITKANIECGNGIIHVIDSVLMPETGSVVDIAKQAGNFQTLLKAATAAGLAEALMGEGPFTVLAPTDEAFAALGDRTISDLLKKSNRDRLATILKYHVIPGRLFASDLIAARTPQTLLQRELDVSLTNGRLGVNESNVVANDLEASNGIVHVIDSVLMPPNDAFPQPQGRKIIGVFTDSVSRALATQLGIDPKEALLLKRIVKNGPAEQAGLEAFDVIVSIDGHPATSQSLDAAKKKRAVGDEIPIEIIRRGERQSLSVGVGVDRH